MTVFKSFTNTFLAFCKGEITITAQDRYRFACARYHVFQENPTEFVPYEAAWQIGLDLKYDTYTFCFANLPKERQEQWLQFITIITEAEKLGNVLFKADVLSLDRTWLTEEELEDKYFMERYNAYEVCRG